MTTNISIERVNDEAVPNKQDSSSTNVSVLKQQVANYHNYMVSKTGMAADSIIDAFTLDLKTITNLLLENSGSDAVRIYLIKEGNDNSRCDDITFLVVAAKKTLTDPVPEYVDSFSDESAKAYKITCPTPACPPSRNSSYILF